MDPDKLHICGTSILGGWAPLPSKVQVQLRREMLGGGAAEPEGSCCPFTPFTARGEIGRWVESLASETNVLRANKRFRAWCDSTAGLWE